MPIKVRFDKNGWYHPAYGRLGRGKKNEGKTYLLPDMFGERETIKVPIIERSPKPPKQVGEKEITRFKYLPSTARIIDDETFAEEVTAAEDSGEPVPQVERPLESELVGPERLPGQRKPNKPQSAQERTTGGARRNARSARTKH